MLKLDDLVAAANAQYAHLEVEIAPGDVVVFRNALQLDAAERKELQEAGKRHDEDEEADDREVIDLLRDALRVAASDKEAADRLFGAIGDNLGVVLTLWKQYNEGTQVGEA